MSTSTCAHTFTNNRQLPFLNHRKDSENDLRNDIMINPNESYQCVVDLGFELVTLSSAVRQATICAIDSALFSGRIHKSAIS